MFLGHRHLVLYSAPVVAKIAMVQVFQVHRRDKYGLQEEKASTLDSGKSAATQAKPAPPLTFQGACDDFYKYVCGSYQETEPEVLLQVRRQENVCKNVGVHRALSRNAYSRGPCAGEHLLLEHSVRPRRARAHGKSVLLLVRP